jgi:hypothetical protein
VSDELGLRVAPRPGVSFDLSRCSYQIDHSSESPPYRCSVTPDRGSVTMDLRRCQRRV